MPQDSTNPEQLRARLYRDGQPELVQLLEHAEAGAMDVVVVHTIDTLHDDPRMQLAIIDYLASIGVGVAFSKDGTETTAPQGQALIAGLRALVEGLDR